MSSFLAAGRAAPRVAPSFIKKGAKRKGKNQKTTKFEGLVPTLPVDGWEPHFWETDGWEVPAAVAGAAAEESAPSAPSKKWWHVADAEIEQMLAEKQGKDQVVPFPRDVERVEPHVEAVEEVAEVPEVPEPSEDGEEKEKEKPWKVTDEQLQRWIDDMQHALEASAYDDVGGGATERSLEKHLQGILSPRKAPKIRVFLSVGRGTLVLRVPEDLPLDLVESAEARRLRQQKTMRPRRKASLALERLLGSRSTEEKHQAALESDRHRGHCLTRIIQSLTKIPCDNQRLIHQKRILRPPGTLKDLGVFDGHELTLVPKVSKGEANPLTLQTGGALHLIEPWRWDDNPKLLAQRRNDDAGFNTSEVHLNDAQDPVLGRLRTQLGIMK